MCAKMAVYKKRYYCYFIIVAVLMHSVSTTANPHAKRLYDDLLANYNRLIRPVSNNTDKLTVKLGLKLSQLIDVDLKNQVMTTNVWVEQKWRDYKLQWDPEDYGGVDMLYVPSQHIWLPDIVLFNNADGKYEVTLMTKARLKYSGEVVWKPPAIYKSSCKINVEWFPFDEQNCDMKFGSWTYDGYQLDLKHVDQVRGSSVVQIGIDLKEFYLSVEWDILKVPAARNEEYYLPQSSAVANMDEEPKDWTDEELVEKMNADEDSGVKLLTDITFFMTLRRKTLFYTVNLIIPCVGISFLTVLVFYLPSDSGEKVTLCISILLSLTVFFLLLAEIIPPTSLAVPLLGKYLLFTMILVTLSILVTVGVLNIHFRSPATHRMSPWVRKLFINIMPRLLFMQRPHYAPRYTAGLPEAIEGKMTLTSTGTTSTCKSRSKRLKPNGHIGSTLEAKWDEDFDDNSSYKDECRSRCHHHPHLRSPSPHSHHSHHRHHHCHCHHHHHHCCSSNTNTLQSSLGAPHGPLPPEPHSPCCSRRQSIVELDCCPAATDCPDCSGGERSRVSTLEKKRGSTAGEDSSNSQVKAALKGVEFIAQHIKKADKDNEVIEDWKFIAMVLDRFFLVLFTVACLTGTGGIILRAPSLYDLREPIDQKLSEIPKYII